MSDMSGSAPDDPKRPDHGQTGQVPPPPPQPGAPGAEGHPAHSTPGQSHPSAPPPQHRPAPTRGPAGANADERTWSLLAHLSYFVIPVIGPLIIMLTKGTESRYVRHHAVEALNFHITIYIVVLISIPLALIIVGFITMAVALVAGIVLTILASIAANNGELYRYPWNIRLVK